MDFSIHHRFELSDRLELDNFSFSVSRLAILALISLISSSRSLIMTLYWDLRFLVIVAYFSSHSDESTQIYSSSFIILSWYCCYWRITLSFSREASWSFFLASSDVWVTIYSRFLYASSCISLSSITHIIFSTSTFNYVWSFLSIQFSSSRSNMTQS